MYVRPSIPKGGEEGLLDDASQYEDSEDEQATMWDVFEEEPNIEEEGSSGPGETMWKALRIVKVFVSIVLFLTVLGGAVIAKGTVLFMASQLRQHPSVIYCDRHLINSPDAQYVAVLPEVERIAWVWMLLFALLVPELGSFLRALRIVLFKPTSWSRPRKNDLFVVLIAETCGTLGIALLAFSVLPDLDVLKGVMLTNCLCFLPTILVLLKYIFPANTEKPEADQEKNKDNKTLFTPKNKHRLQVTAWSAAALAQFTGFIVWPLVERETPSLWIIPIALLLTSCSWWENYVNKESNLSFIKFLAAVKARQKRVRYSTYLLVSLWKMLCFFCAMLAIWSLRGESVLALFDLFHDAFQEHDIPVYMIRDYYGPGSEGMSTISKYITVKSVQSPAWILLIQVFAAYFCYATGKCACRILVQGLSYAAPVTIAVPMSLSLLLIFCGLRNENPCAFEGVIPGYLFFHQPTSEFLNQFLSTQFAWVWLFWLLSQTWVASHIWYYECTRLASTEEIFATPMYSGLVIDQSLALNRRIEDQTKKKENKTNSCKDPAALKDLEANMEQEDDICPESDDEVPRVIGCATMWHETREEMMGLLKSIMRMDEDHCAHRLARDYFSEPTKRNQDYYKFETHIFFDDAFVADIPRTSESGLVNNYVHDLIKSVNEAAIQIYKVRLELEPPEAMTTPYGGRLKWKLPGRTNLIVHLKDSAKIRHKKRWSQVMYMYYFLGNKIEGNSMLDETRKDTIAHNTFLLALDGDIDFQPDAVHKLVDLMKKDHTLGAACGRIHPVGSGVMAWYQKFEYAMGHWLQKATEHVIGCVLCSPGCFSLFRGSALMETNVMARYTKTSQEARHYVQYDQGEDRWLCTLLLQRGFRVEYCAASDAYTHCPEGFGEFYNQRRRWVPSTMANIMDLLGDYRQIVQINDSISFIYIVYQIVLFVGAVLGPGTILLMLVGAFASVFHWSQELSIMANVVPIVIYMMICYFAKSQIQITVAMIYSLVYCLVMIAVLIGILIQMGEDGLLAPTSLFFFIVAGQFIIAAILHPLESGCLPYSIIYYVTVPSMYMLLIIYSLFNLNNVSWGTREVAKTPEQAAAEIQQTVKPGGWKGLLNGFRSKNQKDESYFEVSFFGLFKCMFCTHPKLEEEPTQVVKQLDGVIRKMSTIEKMLTKNVTTMNSIHEDSDEEKSYSDNECHSTSTLPAPAYEEVVKSSDIYWIEADPLLKRCRLDFMCQAEQKFWKNLIAKYLKPIEKNKEKEKRIAHDLKTLRDKSVLGFFLLNAMFVMTLILMQMNQGADILNITWPLRSEGTSNITYINSTMEIQITTQQLKLEPIGLLLLVSFGIVIFIQFIAMLFHRMDTFLHILSTTKMREKKLTGEEELQKYGRYFASILQRPYSNIEKEAPVDQEDQDESDDEAKKLRVRRRSSHAKRLSRTRIPPSNAPLDQTFEHRFLWNLDNTSLRHLTSRKDTIVALQERRSILLSERNGSKSYDFNESTA